MSQPYRYSYNPFALWRLKIFLRRYRIFLIFLVVGAVFALGVLFKKLISLPPADDMRIIGKPSLEDPEAYIIDPQLTIKPQTTYQAPLLRMLPAIDPDGALCPVLVHSDSSALGINAQYSILNLKTRESFFLAAFEKGITMFPLYRPRHNEIMLTNNGARDSLHLRLCQINYLFGVFAEPKIASRLYRFDADTGAYLGRLKLPFFIDPLDISPNGQFLLARRYNTRQTLIDLDTGRHVTLPFLAYWCFFESNDTLIAGAPLTDNKRSVIYKHSIIRYHLRERRVEELQVNIEGYFHSPNGANFHLARKIQKIYFRPQAAVNSIGCLSFGDEVTLEFKSVGELRAFLFQPERGLVMSPENISNDPAKSLFAWSFFDLETGQRLKRLSSEYYAAFQQNSGFLNRDYLWYFLNGKISIVKLDDLLEESFKIDPDREKP